MQETRILMGMPVIVEIVDSWAKQKNINQVFDYFDYVDKKFSTFKPRSEISRINRDELKPDSYSRDMQEIFCLAAQTKKYTDGYFEIGLIGQCDPSGIVKGWAIYNAAKILEKAGFSNFYVNAGSDIEVRGGRNTSKRLWRVGIKNPFNERENVKVLGVSNCGVATSGRSEHGDHIIDPKTGKSMTEISSLTVIGPNIYEADRIVTAAFAMGKKGIHFIEKTRGLEGYMIDNDGQATFTTGFNSYVLTDEVD